MALDRAAILKDGAPSRHLPLVRVDVPEWGGEVWVRTLTGAELDAFEASRVRVGKNGKPELAIANTRGTLAALCCCDEKGARLFSDDDAPELGRLGARGLDRVYDAAARLNGLSKEAVEEARGN